MRTPSSLARLQQVAVLVLLLVALAWVAFSLEASPRRAMAGLLLILCFHAIVLAVEFAVMYVVASGDPAPRPTLFELVRAWWAESIEAVRVFGWRQPFRWSEVPDHLHAAPNGRRGVVFIHGFVCNRGLWTPWMRRMDYFHVPFVAVNLEPVFASVDRYVATVDEAVRRTTAATGLAPVLVCHSMGGLVARAWLRSRPDAAGAVHHVVTIGTPHRGTWLARWSRTPNGRQMRLGSEWLDALERDEAALPARPPFTCWYSNCDNIVFPPSTATLQAADNRLVRGAAHVELAFVPQVMESTLTLITATGEFRTGTAGQKS